MHLLLPSALLALTFATSAHAAPVEYTPVWADSTSGGTAVGSVTMTTTLMGGATLYGSPSGPWVGTSAANDVQLTFSAPVKEVCVYIWWNNAGEAMTVTTNGSGTDVARAVDTGDVITAIAGTTFTWSAMGDADEALACIGDPSGFTTATFDHNGSGNGLVFGDSVFVDGAVVSCTAKDWYLDDDGDGYGSGTSTSACTAPVDHVALSGDCDDDDDASYPGATEVIGDGVDQSCDDEEICYVDADGDDYRTDETVVSEDDDCDDTGEALSSVTGGDCDDGSVSTYPGATEVAYDGIDQDCSGADLCDVDEDGYDDPLCGGSDCADSDVAINPGAVEVYYDGVDADCDGWSDDDADMDGFDVDEDCDDADPSRSPGASERWYDGVDQDCSGGSDADQDGDGFDAVAYGGTDCDDLSSVTYPGAAELSDGLDNDCNGLAETDDADEDGLADELELELGLDPDSDDSDEDGVLDRDELGDPEDPTDSDGDGLIDALDSDDDQDGIPTSTEVAQSLKTLDSDVDGVPDYLDVDSDDDGYDDVSEGDVDSDFDGVPDYIDVDSDDDGVPDVDEADGDSDEDGIEDRLDVDDDGDGLPTSEEGSWEADLDGDGVPNHLDTDSDGDGILDGDELWSDADCDGVMDAVEVDSEDGPCAQEVPGPAFHGGDGCSSTSAPAGLGGLGLGLLLLLGLRRRE